MSKRPSHKLHNRLEGLFGAVPEADPRPGSNGGGRQPPFASGVPGGWLWEADLQGRYTWCSPEVERFLGWRAADLLGKDVAATGLSDESAAMVRPMIESGRAVDGLRLEARASDGSEIQLLFSAQLRPGLNGKPAGFRGAVQVLSILPAAFPEAHGVVADEPTADVEVPGITLASEPDPRHGVSQAPGASPSPAESSAEAVAKADEPIIWPSMQFEAEAPAVPPVEVSAEPSFTEATPLAAAPGPQAPEIPAEERRVLDRPTRPVARPQTGSLRRQTGSLRRQTGPLASQLAVTAAVAAEEVRPIESPPLLAAWGPTTAYLDTAAGIQPISAESGRTITEPRIDGTRLLVPIKVKDEVLGVLAFDENEQGRPWTDDDITMALAISEQLAVALQDARSIQLTEQALEEMREADRLKTQFLANMSHELRTPLNSIIGFSRVILKGIDGPVNETQSQDLNAIHHAGLHLPGLINDILDVSKIEAGKMELTFGDADLREIVRGVMSTAAGLVKDKSIELISHVPESLPLVQADSIRVRQILLNLVSNAAKFTDQGQIEVSAALMDDVDPPEMLLSVADTGPGIAPEDQAKLFEPFSQVDASPTRKTGGTGLGLSICRHLVELHGGTIWVESQPGKGSAFFFTLPLQPPGGTVEVETAQAAPFVLAVDDDPAVLTRYREVFEGLGLRFHGLLHTEGLAEFAAGMPPDLIVIDPMLPSYAGWNAVTALRAVRGLRHAPILMGSLNTEKGHAFRIHASDHRLRAIEAEELREAVHHLVPGGRAMVRLLAIDDQESASDALQEALQGDPRLSVRMATSSTEAYHITRSEIPDVVILSLMMARAEGFRALEIMRKDQRLRSTPVVVLLSAEPHPEERRQMGLYADYIHRQGTASPDEYLAELQGLARTLSRR
jgi:PAS domain S-box-containing protein